MKEKNVKATGQKGKKPQSKSNILTKKII